MGNEYSSWKMVRWYAREGKLPDAPKQVQVILSDLCNQDCHFCHEAGTLIYSTAGNKRVENVQVGDRVTGPDGEDYCVTRVGKRRCAEKVVIGSSDGRYITLTREHPVLTLRGWIAAGKVLISDWVMMEANNHYRWGIAPVRVGSVNVFDEESDVYSLEVEEIHSYIADGFIVHNCAYRMSGYSSNELFLGDSPVAKYGHNNPVRFMPTERALRLMDELKEAGVLAVQFTGGGEPTVHAEHTKVFLRALAGGLKCALVSNGVRWDTELRQNILPQFEWVRVSIDAGTPATYSRIRNCSPDHWERALGNVADLARSIKVQGSLCLLGIGWVVTPENWQEIVEGVRVAKETGAAYVRMSAMFNPEHEEPYREIWEPIKEAIREAKGKYEGEGFAVHDLFGERLEDLQQGRPDYKTCAYQSYTSYIGADLRPYRCCVLAYNKRGIIAGGSVAERRFDDFWGSAERKADFEAFDARGCDLCQFNSRNRPMSYILADSAKHEEFP